MKIGDLLQKEPWERRTVRQAAAKSMQRGAEGLSSKIPFNYDSGLKIRLNQSDFMDELCPLSHKVYDVNWRSDRPKFVWDDKQQKNVQVGKEEVKRVAVAFQSSIRRKKAVGCGGNSLWIGNESADDRVNEVATVKSHWNVTGMDSGLLQVYMSCFGTGDGAIYMYKEGNDIKYKTFSFENGDVFAVNRDLSTGEDVFVRMFSFNGMDAVEIYRDTTVDLWVKGQELGKLKKWWNIVNGKLSEDGYTLVSSTRHGLTQCPVAYHRENDVPWGVAQPTIEHIESTLSDLAENNKYYAFQILFMRGGSFELPSSGFQGKALGGKSETSDAKILQPANASDSFTLDLEKNIGYIYESTSTTEVRPDQLKGGDYSGAYLRNLYFRDVQWVTEASARLNPFINKVLSVFKEYVGLIERDPMTYGNLKLSHKIIPFIPKNEMEEVTILNNCVANRTISFETATEELAMANPNELDRLAKERELWEKKDMPEPDNVDNNALSKKEE